MGHNQEHRLVYVPLSFFQVCKTKSSMLCQAFLSKKPSKKTQGQKLKRKKLKKLLSSENAEKMSKRPEYAVCCVLKCSTITTDPTRQQRCDVSPGLQWSFGPDLPTSKARLAEL